MVRFPKWTMSQIFQEAILRMNLRPLRNRPEVIQGWAVEKTEALRLLGAGSLDVLDNHSQTGLGGTEFVLLAQA